jgi:hypothetical protein
MWRERTRFTLAVMRRSLIGLLVAAVIAAGCSSDSASPGSSALATTTPASAAITDEPATTPAPPASTGDSAPDTTGVTTTEAAGPVDPGMVPSSDDVPVEPLYVSALYADPAENWICRPDLIDACDDSYPLTEVAADGATTLEPYTVAADPPADCFYVYPTISGDQSFNSDLVPDNEIGVTRVQAARFNQVCRLYVPVYRSVTIGGLFGTVDGDFATGWEMAYADVLDAWRSYMANDNDGRPVVILSHSQGSFHVTRLLREEIDPDPDQRAVVLSAMLAGTSFQVAPGKDVGGDTQNMPLCRAADQFGCVITFQSFRADDPPRAGALFGRPGDGTESACTNPAALGGGAGQPASVFINGDWVSADAAVRSAITTDRVGVPGLITTECRVADGYNYLAVTVNGDPADPRGDDIPGDGTPNWGLHTVDIDISQESLIGLVRTQLAAYQAALD